MATSAVQPRLSMAVRLCQTPSQAWLRVRPSSVSSRSRRAPRGLVLKKKPPRRVRLATRRSAWLSKQRTAEVEVVVVKQDAHLGPLARRGALDGLALEEVGHGRGLPPDGVVEAAVDAWRGGGTLGLEDRGFFRAAGNGQYCQGRGAPCKAGHLHHPATPPVWSHSRPHRIHLPHREPRPRCGFLTL